MVNNLPPPAHRVTPPERIDPENAYRLDEMTSACPTPGLDAAGRLDPYYDGLWTTGSSASWVSAGLAERQVNAGLRRMPAALKLSEDQAWESLLGTNGVAWRNRLRFLATLDMWRVASCEQVAAISGVKRLADSTSPIPAEMFTAGMADLGIFTNGLYAGALGDRGSLYRTSHTDVFDDQMTKRLTWPEWVAVTGGKPWASSVRHDRHNLLATELGLRLAEYADIGTVLGEKLSTIDLLAGSGLGQEPLVGNQKSADLTVVRPDGLRIAVEITATVSKAFYDKVRAWAKLIAERPLETSGLCVVFVAAQHPERRQTKNGYLPRTRTYQAIRDATREFPGTARDRVAARMGVASWPEWFPANGLVSQDFLGMRVDRPTGPADDLWQTCDMLDPAQLGFAPTDPAAMRAVLDNAHMLAGVPHWLRTVEQAPQIWPLLLSNAGLSEIPVPPPKRTNRTKGRPLGAGVGAVGPAKPPRRLLPF